MLIFIISALLLIAGIICLNKNDMSLTGTLLITIGGFGLAVALITLPVINSSVKSEIREYYAIQSTVEVARNSESISDIERAALTTKIIEANQWVVTQQYWNGTIFDIWIPDEVMELELLK